VYQIIGRWSWVGDGRIVLLTTAEWLSLRDEVMAWLDVIDPQ
jgi:hypothetical protein